MRTTSRANAAGYACDALSASDLPEYLRPLLTVKRPKHPLGRLRRSAASAGDMCHTCNGLGDAPPKRPSHVVVHILCVNFDTERKGSIDGKQLFEGCSRTALLPNTEDKNQIKLSTRIWALPCWTNLRDSSPR